MGKASRRIAVAIGLLIGGLFLWLALRDVQLSAVASSLRSANLWMAIPFLLSLALFYWLKAVRWSILLRPTRDIPARELVPSMMIGFAGNNVLPVRLGELLRIFALGKEQDISISTVFGTVVLERVFDVVTLLILLTAALYASPFTSTEFEAARTFILIAAILAILATYGIAASPAWMISLLKPILRLLPARLRPPVMQRLTQLRQGFAVLTKSSGHAIILISINSILQWALLAFAIHLSIMAFDVGPDPTAAVLILGLLVAGISLPSAPAFVGTIEYCFVLGLGLFGVSPDIALSIGIYYHAITFIAVTLSGAYFLRRFDSSLGKMAKAASGVKDAGT